MNRAGERLLGSANKSFSQPLRQTVITVKIEGWNTFFPDFFQLTLRI
ncbi:hypothetical protein STRCR_2127 [Streptococcus criceti HS-6]|uniref:Uncharacterized protein n=1 Tax=Streptococcus criceti HS-6 TaxID=873449 RepID=G5JS47_STRCG|nr:hypothetical protein STRCR_2127 [Streptococcus criceti HS-6]